MNQSLFAHFAFRSDPFAEFTVLIVMAGWVGFVVIAAAGNRAAVQGAERRNATSRLGFLLQFVGYGICFTFYRQYFSPLFPMPRVAEAILTVFQVALVIASVWLCYAAARALGRQWAMVARVIKNHELITAGPFSIVRNPIYLSMLGMYFATGLAVGCWQAILAGLVIFLAGTAIRIRAEETLLREKFGPSFAEYARRVPAFFPGLPR